MSSKNLPQLFAEALTEKRLELFDEFIHLNLLYGFKQSGAATERRLEGQ